MLYEYGIQNTYLQGIKDQIMTSYEYTSPSTCLCFRVPLHKEKHRIQGLNVSCLYRSSVSKDKDMWHLLAKISNTTKRLTWIYNPVIYCKPSVDEDVVWLSHWPIGNTLDVGDEVKVVIYADNLLIVSGCGASLVYMGDEVEQKKYKNNTREMEEVIGGDLFEFEIVPGGYYLCRRDFFKSKTSTWFKELFGDNIDYIGNFLFEVFHGCFCLY